jgi:hypothetical protein
MLEDEGVQPCSPVARRIFAGPAKVCPRLQRINARESRLSLVQPNSLAFHSRS